MCPASSPVLPALVLPPPPLPSVEVQEEQMSQPMAQAAQPSSALEDSTPPAVSVDPPGNTRNGKQQSPT
ncbi:hypothetical protein Pcinc_017456 [Petrolisthes cinctipes]|uniref:Uncharacterized protein n=1 Tax=Petrolisthes cinctipes TaxID=88211 RepID=A0AAE1FP66_PETCI|nr:hypothetical protein Pcinc_017456 [Petrolisthes cinctipes]